MAAGLETSTAPVAAMLTERTASLSGALFLLMKPGIVLAETVAGLAGILLACGGRLPPATTLFLALVTLVMAASGAAMGNSVLDAEADRRMPRLAARNRAMATVGKVRVLAIALLLMGGAFFLTAHFFNSLTLFLLAAACSSYLFLYTRWLKRRTPWGVLAGAIPGALPPLIGSAAVTGDVAALSLLLGIVMFIWQLPHFWFLALHYSHQYRQAGIPVLPLTHGVRVTKRLTLLSSAALVPATLTFSLLGHLSPLFTFAALFAGIFYLFFSYRYLCKTAEYCKGFIVSLAYLAAILFTLIIDVILTVKY